VMVDPTGFEPATS